MENNEKELKVHKRDAEINEGRDLLVSYLGNVGGYDRQYRSVDSQEEGEGNSIGQHFIVDPFTSFQPK